MLTNSIFKNIYCLHALIRLLSRASSSLSHLFHSRCRSCYLSHIQSLSLMSFLHSHYYVLAPPPHSHSRPVSLPLRLLSLSVATLCGVDECMKGTISVGLGVKVCVSITFLSFWVLWCFLLFIQNWNLFQGKVGLIFTLSFFFFFLFLLFLYYL